MNLKCSKRICLRGVWKRFGSVHIYSVSVITFIEEARNNRAIMPVFTLLNHRP